MEKTKKQKEAGIGPFLNLMAGVVAQFVEWKCPWFKSSHWEIFMRNVFAVEKRKIKNKEAGMAI